MHLPKKLFICGIYESQDVYHHSYICSNCLILVRVMVDLEPSPKTLGKRYSGWDGSPSQGNTHCSFTSTAMFLGDGRKPETHTYMRRICETPHRPWNCDMIMLLSALSLCRPRCLAQNKLFSDGFICILQPYAISGLQRSIFCCLTSNISLHSVSLCSDVTHQQADWNSIHEKVCELLISIRTAAPLNSFKADRDFHHIQTLKTLVHHYDSVLKLQLAYTHTLP